jgi:hypothetical protein
MAAPLVRHEPQNNESSTRIKRAAESEERDDRSALMPAAPSREVKMKIPRGMPVLPGGRRMPPLPVRLRESLEPLRRSFAPIRRSLAPLFGKEATDLDLQALTRKRRWPVVVLLLVVAAGVAAVLLSRGA